MTDVSFSFRASEGVPVYPKKKADDFSSAFLWLVRSRSEPHPENGAVTNPADDLPGMRMFRASVLFAMQAAD
jgi:hypothetical protein